MTDRKQDEPTEQRDELRDLDLPNESAQEIKGGKASVSDLRVLKHVDTASPILMSDLGSQRKS
jgi:type VI protein secretion system component Hcp